MFSLQPPRHISTLHIAEAAPSAIDGRYREGSGRAS